MEVEPSPVLEGQRKNHPELGELIDQLQKHADAKLYHQLTNALLQYLSSAPFTGSTPAVAAELIQFFDGFVRPFESKFDKVRWVQILAIICKPQSPQKALDVIAPFEAPAAGLRDAKYMWLALKAEKLTLSGETNAAKELLENLGKEINDAYEVDALIQSTYYKTHGLLWKTLGRPHEYYKSSIKYMRFTPLAKIPPEEQARLAFEIGCAALIAEEEFDFGELLQQELLLSLDGSPYAWIKDLLKAFGEGSFNMLDSAFTRHRAEIDKVPELAAKEASVLRPKMCALALMELAFRKERKQRRLHFDEIAGHCRLAQTEVEFLVMKAMCANLIRGQIDEVAQLVLVTWVKPRILDKPRLDALRQRVDTWSNLSTTLLQALEDKTPELLVS